MNRSAVMIPNISYLVENLTFKLSNEIATALTISILTKDYLVSANADVVVLLKVICKRLASPEEFSKKLLIHLTSEFDKVKLQASISQADKLKLLLLVCAASNFLAADSVTLA